MKKEVYHLFICVGCGTKACAWAQNELSLPLVELPHVYITMYIYATHGAPFGTDNQTLRKFTTSISWNLTHVLLTLTSTYSGIVGFILNSANEFA